MACYYDKKLCAQQVSRNLMVNFKKKLVSKTNKKKNFISLKVEVFQGLDPKFVG